MWRSLLTDFGYNDHGICGWTLRACQPCIHTASVCNAGCGCMSGRLYADRNLTGGEAGSTFVDRIAGMYRDIGADFTVDSGENRKRSNLNDKIVMNCTDYFMVIVTEL